MVANTYIGDRADGEEVYHARALNALIIFDQELRRQLTEEYNGRDGENDRDDDEDRECSGSPLRHKPWQ